MSAFDKQEGGGHYKDYAIQPIEFITKNKIGFIEGCVIKRMCRWRAKGGAEDLRKAIHEIQLLLEMETGDANAEFNKALDAIIAADEVHTQDAQKPVPAADPTLQRYRVSEGGKWPVDALNGTVVEVWRPIGPGRGCRFERIGFMWDGELVREG